MSVSDFIADQLTVIRNANRVGKKSALVKRSGTVEGLLEIVRREGFIDNFKVIEDNKQGMVKVYLKYLEDGTPCLEAINRISKPGRRVYICAEDVKEVRGGVGISIMSTNKGLMTDSEAREAGVGGEVLCEIW
ncbi:MAG: 30S ribosomal protein S8 [Candidatus Omnitrophica bacterium]|nr:30S ribosomal protein S8 [Candidatus Omnitrophota bacterium]